MENEEEAVEEIGISVENTMWANTVLAAGNAVGLVIYTGRETRSVMNNSAPRSKTGLIDLEINNLTKVNFCFKCQDVQHNVIIIGTIFIQVCFIDMYCLSCTDFVRRSCCIGLPHDLPQRI